MAVPRSIPVLNAMPSMSCQPSLFDTAGGSSNAMVANAMMAQRLGLSQQAMLVQQTDAQMIQERAALDAQRAKPWAVQYQQPVVEEPPQIIYVESQQQALSQPAPAQALPPLPLQPILSSFDRPMLPPGFDQEPAFYMSGMPAPQPQLSHDTSAALARQISMPYREQLEELSALSDESEETEEEIFDDGPFSDLIRPLRSGTLPDQDELTSPTLLAP